MALPSTTYDTLTVQTNPSSALTDFTLVIDLSRLSAAWWTAVGAETDGTKGRAAKDDGTELATDWIDFDPTADTGWLRVKWSGTLATSGTQTIRIYPPVAANSANAASATYGSDNVYDSNWEHYWQDAQADRVGSTDLTAGGGVTVGGVTGKVASATEFDNTDDQMSGTLPVNIPSSFTIMFWARRRTGITLGNPYWFSKDTTDLLVNTPNANFWTDGVNTGTANFLDFTADTDWHHVACVFNGSTRLAYADGSLISSNAGSVPSSTVNSVRIGGGGTTWIGSDAQEYQLHHTDRSADWIATEYAQANSQATFWGSPTNVPVGGGSNITAIMHHRRLMGVS